MSLHLGHRLMQIGRIHNVITLERGLGQMPRNLHGDVSRNTGSNEIPDPASTKIMNQQALILPNLGACLDSQSYLNACGLKSLPQIPSIEHPAFRRQVLDHFVEFNWKGEENRLLVLCLVPHQTELCSS